MQPSGPFWDELRVVVAGLAGALVNILVVGDFRIVRIVAALSTGAFCAKFLSGFIITYLNLGDSSREFVAALLGVTGYVFIQRYISAWNDLDLQKTLSKIPGVNFSSSSKDNRKKGEKDE